MLVRRGHAIGPLDGPPALPWAVGPSDVDVTTTAMEPSDSVLFYTDGVIEARGGQGEDFRAARLTDVVGRHASDQLPVGLIVRLVDRAVREHHGGQLHDDATVLMVHWPGPLNDHNRAPNAIRI